MLQSMELQRVGHGLATGQLTTGPQGTPQTCFLCTFVSNCLVCFRSSLLLTVVPPRNCWFSQGQGCKQLGKKSLINCGLEGRSETSVILPLISLVVSELPSFTPIDAVGFPGCSVVKNPWVRKIPGRRKWQPTPVFLPGKSHGQGCLVGYSPWGCKRVRQDLVTEYAHLYRCCAKCQDIFVDKTKVPSLQHFYGGKTDNGHDI